MNKTAIKNFAVWARNKLIADITYKASLLGVTEAGINAALPQSTKDVEFYDIGTKEPYAITGEALRQRKQLAERIAQKAKDSDYKTAWRSVLEEVAYTWFNRLIAIRFMEVNDYLPSRIRVLSSESGTKLEPDLVTTPFEAELALSDYDKAEIVRLKTENQVDELFRLLFIRQCNALNAILPKLFEKTADYTELLLNVSVTDQDGVVYHLVHDISEDDFNIEKGGQVEIIGWLYQYYNTEPKDEAFALLKKNVKITKERIPAATQLFTPDWIVRYMVENSLGRLWVEGHPSAELKAGWKYYLEEAQQVPEVEAQLAKIREEYKAIRPEDIKVIDPCMGSGHILVYAFDVLMQIYEAAGYAQRDAAKSILEHNLYGLDIDDRAFQLAYFAVLMKARQYNRRILDGETDCHVYAIQESNGINRNHLKYLGAGMSDLECHNAQNQLNGLLDTFTDAREYGSILNVEPCSWNLLRRFAAQSSEEGQQSLDSMGLETTKEQVLQLIAIGQAMAQKYDVVVTNPPYMGSSGMEGKLSEFVKKNYPDSKADLFAVFMERCGQMTAKNRYQAMITQHAWMFLSSFEKLREKLLQKDTVNMAHLGARAFEEIGGEVVQTTSFVLRGSHIAGCKGVYCRLIEPTTQQGKEEMFLRGKNRFEAAQDNFSKIPGAPIAYWVKDTFFKAFIINPSINSLSDFTGSQHITANNERFLRNIWEVHRSSRWKMYAKGGERRKWYGNIIHVVDWSTNAQYFYSKNSTSNMLSDRYIDKKGIVYTDICTTGTGFRYFCGGAFDKSGPEICSVEPFYYILGLLNSAVFQYYANIVNPTIHLQVKDIKQFPVIIDEEYKNKVSIISQNNVDLSQFEWDSFETSWDFVRHPFVCEKHTVKEAFARWQSECNDRFNTLKANEEELNRIFIDIYGLQDELTPEEDDKDVTVRKADLGRDIRSLLSYAVGCMFGRYSLDVPGLAYAGGAWDDSKYTTFIPDKDNILPITDEEYFEDDIVGLLIAWLKKVYGEKTLEENLDFIAGALGSKGSTSREVIRNYFVNDFFKDHCKTYQKRPIYWLFDSGKQNGFKALIYLHRYDENTIGNLRIDYLHRMERVYESEIARMQDVIDNSAAAREVTAAAKRKEKLLKQLKECRDYDEKIAHLALARISLDLDDGVKVNYRRLQTGTDGKFYEVLADSKDIMAKE
jgi:hypothetical protein